MKLAHRTHRVRLLLAPLALAAALPGCAHKSMPPPPPPVVTAPPLKPDSMTVEQSLPPVPPATVGKVNPPGAPPAAAPSTTATAPPPRHRRHKTEAAAGSQTQTPAPTQTAPAAAAAAEAAPQAAPAAANPSAAPADNAVAGLVELSAGSPVNGADRNAMLDQIKQQENRLRSLKASSTNDGAAVVTQVRSFLDKARQALTENDLDGARILTTKAKLLIDELSGS